VQLAKSWFASPFVETINQQKFLTNHHSGMLFGVSPTDPATIAGVLALVLAVSAGAALVPALRAARVEPMQSLREE